MSFNDQGFLSPGLGSWIASARSTQLVAELNKLYPSKPQAITWADVAQKTGVTTLYNTVYRDMSGDGAHATIEALNRHVHADTNSNIEGLKFGPETEGIADALSAVTSALLHAMDALSRVYKGKKIDAMVKTHMEACRKLAIA